MVIVAKDRSRKVQLLKFQYSKKLMFTAVLTITGKSIGVPYLAQGRSKYKQNMSVIGKAKYFQTA